MNVGIVGSREYTNYVDFAKHVDNILNGLEIASIISGGAKGTDALAEKYATINNIPITIYKADWNKYGRSAGPIRNTRIAKECDFLIAFVAKNSIGTLDTIRKVGNKKCFRIDLK